MKISIITLGCRTNQAESMTLEHNFAAKGHTLVDLSEEPDLCIINTCTVTAGADQQSRQLIQKAVRGGRRVIVTGCYGELNQEALQQISGDLTFVSNKDKSHIINLIRDESSDDAIRSSVGLSSPVSRHRAIVKVQDGCNYACSYCAIPLARGRSRSLPLDGIMERIRECEAMGYKEVVLTGIHLGTYGIDLEPLKDLPKLIGDILVRTKIPRVRLSSLEVREVDERLLDLLQEQRVCSHLHLPLQSGDDKLLKSMNRMYTSVEFIGKVEEVARRVPGIGLGTDVIVGFPGEGEAEFLNTRRILEELPFSYLHIFPYSQRPKTRAAGFSGQVPGPVKKERASDLRALGDRKKEDFISGHVDQTIDLLIEERVKDGWSGTTGNYIKGVVPDCDGIQPGSVVNARVIAAEKGLARAVVE
ncbi:MAG: tRNA (N(6)-L-threonylcarbamoyladenosine(37)-C(2))-methylthiotransferase MtaB [Nitrospirales bacterium]|nr:tRNA (N(6)-L-threonylcarbamoyladenosine(37)-C(2))-methylthiotransferase MtaB [Nitrospirales bacterium]